ncbi:MAG: IS1380 family transposase [Pseudomonadota bacterium]
MKKLTQSVLKFKLEETEKDSQLTSYAGVPLIYELYRKLKISKIIEKHLKVKEAGWSENELIEAIIGITVSGGEHMEDVRMLQGDRAFQSLVEKKGSVSDERKSKNTPKALPSSKALERFLERFDSGLKKPEGVNAWIPEESKSLKNLAKVNREVAKKLISLSGITTATIENDATAVFSHKRDALGTYKGGRGYMPVLGSIAELGLIIGDEFRDGNVPPAYDVKRFFKESLKSLPKSIKQVRTRLDGAYYNHDFIKYLNDPKKQFGKIEFTITGELSKSILEWIEALPEKEWKPLYKIAEKGKMVTEKEWIEMHWTSANGTRKTMNERSLRTIVTRKKDEQWELFQEEFHDEVKKKDRYEVIVTNREWEGDRLIRWHYERGGSIEHLNDRIKNDLAGGVFPCAEFGANAAWWRIQCLAWNLIRALQLHALPEELRNCHMKRLRFKLLCIAGKVVKTARRIILKLSRGHPSFNIYKEAREKIFALAVP